MITEKSIQLKDKSSQWSRMTFLTEARKSIDKNGKVLWERKFVLVGDGNWRKQNLNYVVLKGNGVPRKLTRNDEPLGIQIKLLYFKEKDSY